jgi:hypothetical protein
MNMTTVLLFPTLPLIVAASSGSIIANVLPNEQHARLTVVVSYIC